MSSRAWVNIKNEFIKHKFKREILSIGSVISKAAKVVSYVTEASESRGRILNVVKGSLIGQAS